MTKYPLFADKCCVAFSLVRWKKERVVKLPQTPACAPVVVSALMWWNITERGPSDCSAGRVTNSCVEGGREVDESEVGGDSRTKSTSCSSWVASSVTSRYSTARVFARAAVREKEAKDGFCCSNQPANTGLPSPTSRVRRIHDKTVTHCNSIRNSAERSALARRKEK